jgi:hypothetical protein
MRQVGVETYIPTSVSRGHSLNDETGRWNNLRQATTRDNQLAVHSRGQVSLVGQDYIATGVSQAKFGRFKAFDAGVGVSPSKLQTANRILTAANINVAGMSNRDKVLLARLAVKDHATAEKIFRLASYEHANPIHRQLSSALLETAQSKPQLALQLADQLDQPFLTGAQANSLAQLARQQPETASVVYSALQQQHAGGLAGKVIGADLLQAAQAQPAEAKKLGELLLTAAIPKATAEAIMQAYVADRPTGMALASAAANPSAAQAAFPGHLADIDNIAAHDPVLAPKLVEMHFAYGPELHQLGLLADRVVNGPPVP